MNQSCTTAGTPRSCYSGDLSQILLRIPGTHQVSIDTSYTSPVAISKPYSTYMLQNFKCQLEETACLSPYDNLRILCIPPYPPFLGQGRVTHSIFSLQPQQSSP